MTNVINNTTFIFKLCDTEYISVVIINNERILYKIPCNRNRIFFHAGIGW